MPVTQEAPTPSALDRALDILHKAVAARMTSDGWREALEFRTRFHRYSFFNTSLILAQRPDARLVAGYRAWQQAGRQVRKGERGIAILAPLFRRDPDDPDQKVLTGFRTVNVFDVSQTDGDPVPTHERPRLLEDRPEDLLRLSGFDDRLATHCAGLGVTVRFDFEHDSALGMYRPGTKEIAVRADLGPVQRFKTLTHEVAHLLLHDAKSERVSAELEAESAAFLVCHALGVDTGGYSFAYLAHWADSLDALVQAGERASKAADTILGVLGVNREAVAAGGEAIL